MNLKSKSNSLSDFVFFDMSNSFFLFIFRMFTYVQIVGGDAGGGGAGGARAPPKFGILVNPIRTKGGRLCPPYYYWPPHLFGRCGASELCIVQDMRTGPAERT